MTLDVPTNTDWSQLPASAAAEALSSPEVGLTAAEASNRLAVYGTNELVDRGGRTRVQILAAQFTSVLTIVLIVAAIISLFLGDWIETAAILAIVVLNAVMGYVQEYKAEEAMAALKRMAVPVVRVRRDGEVQEVSSVTVVPGDRVLLETGNLVPSDGRLASSTNLRIEEAALTGESEPVDKRADRVYESERAIAERRNVAYMGTTVTMGRGELIVTATGMGTELGRIAGMLQEVEDEKTPLQRRLDHLGRILAAAAGVIVVVLFFIGLARGEDLETMLLTSVSLAVAAIPEALPAVVTIALSLGAQRMLRRNALIRRLPAVETLGSVDVICSDKTGTLTENRMTVVVVDVAEQSVTLTDGAEPASSDVLPTLELALLTGSLCNDAALVATDEGFRAIGDPTEGALVVAAARFGIAKDEVEEQIPRIAELPFDSSRKRMTTVHRVPRTVADAHSGLAELWSTHEGHALPPAVGFTKGAIDGLLEVSNRVWVEGSVLDLDPSWRQRIQEAEAALASEGMRVLGVAVREHEDPPPTGDSLERDLVFVGMFGLIDPARPEVPPAVQMSQAAGIRPVMITGDHPLTARHIAHEIGITDDDRVVIGLDLDTLDREGMQKAANDVSVFARVSPEHKLELIQAHQDMGHLVAMTGDGVNDAPALKKADIGVAMGITGTDVSKQASDMVLLDDNFATIVAAVEEGRVIYDNIRKFIKYLLTCNTSEVLVMIIGPLIGMPLPLLALQILWMNLVTDGLPALALGVEPAEEDVMRRPPRSASETIFGGGAAQFMAGFGTLLAAVTIAIGYSYWDADNSDWQSMIFTVLIFGQLGLALEVRSERRSLLSVGLFTNLAMLGAVGVGVAAHIAILYVPFLQEIFGTVPLGARDLATAIAAALLIMLAVEVQKVVARARTRPNARAQVNAQGTR